MNGHNLNISPLLREGTLKIFIFQDITAAFPDLEITSITIERPDVRVKAGARLRLARPEVLDNWPVSRQVVFVSNKEVSVCVGSSEGWLCVARLAPDTEEEEFSQLVSSYGVVGESFLVVSEVTGAGKGYGLVRYKCSQAAAQARHLLDNKTVRGYSIQVSHQHHSQREISLYYTLSLYSIFLYSILCYLLSLSIGIEVFSTTISILSCSLG